MPPMIHPTGPVAEMTVGDFSAALASERPTPGGGSAAAVAAAMAASLTEMVVRLSIDRPRYQQHAGLHEEALRVASVARSRFLGLADEDASAYAAYLDARRLPQATEAEGRSRVAASQEAAREAAAVPMAVVQACHRQIDLVDRLVGRTNAAAASDLDVAAMLLECAARGAAANVLVNLPAIEDEGYSAAVTAELDQRLQQVQRATARIRERVGKGGQRPPEAA
jgi:formiminotetrahydrofolate cyclodeaminase